MPIAELSMTASPPKAKKTAEAGIIKAPSAEQTAIRVEGVSVQYRIPRERITSLKEYAIRLLQQRVQHDEFFALRDVSFSVAKGEAFGIIGRNGAGKSTLLKVVARVLTPTTGKLWFQGRIAPLLELGAGFHPELTGRENIYLNGTLLGYKRAEINSLFDEIVEFAELWDFIDAPLRTYSSGMAARLGFSVATISQPDILLADEILSVGDEKFSRKCEERMQKFQRNGTTILLVSHSSEMIRSMCRQALWLDRGKIKAIGAAEDVVSRYNSI